jgi:hypothetical protein
MNTPLPQPAIELWYVGRPAFIRTVWDPTKRPKQQYPCEMDLQDTGTGKLSLCLTN